jgi:hypothetical protein
MSLLSDVVVTFLSSVVVSTPKAQFLDCASIAFGEQYYWECLGKCLWIYRVMLCNLLDQVWLVKWPECVEIIHHTFIKTQWLRYCATHRKVAGSIPAGVIRISHWHKPSDRTMALRSTQPLTEMSTRSISWGCVRPYCAVVMKSGNLNFLEPSEPLQACNGTALPFIRIADRSHNNLHSLGRRMNCTVYSQLSIKQHGNLSVNVIFY